MTILDKRLPHQPVLAAEAVDILHPKHGGNFLDATIGYAGHAQTILNQLNRSSKPYHYWGLDLDQSTLNFSQARLHKYKKHLTLVHGNFRDVVMLIKKIKFDGILLDLGVSSPQLGDPHRGLSFQFDAPLDMRLNYQAPVGRHTLTAAKIINYWSLPRLTKLFQTLGEEPYSYQIAKNIVSSRQKQPIETTGQLVELIRKATPPAYRFGRQIHFATNIFRALRMAVNDELGALESFLKQLPGLTNSGCRIVIISFHSLEDRLVKQYFKKYADDQQAKLLSKKPIEPSSAEIVINPRSRSAKLRALEWLPKTSIV